MGTLDLLILARLARGAIHGFGIAEYLAIRKRMSVPLACLFALFAKVFPVVSIWEVREELESREAGAGPAVTEGPA